MILKKSKGNVSEAEGRFLFFKEGNGYVFRANTSFHLKDETRFRQSFLGQRAFSVYDDQGRNVGDLLMHARRRVSVTLYGELGNISEEIKLFEYALFPKREFVFLNAKYKVDPKSDSLDIQSESGLFERAVALVGCLYLAFLSPWRGDESAVDDADGGD